MGYVKIGRLHTSFTDQSLSNCVVEVSRDKFFKGTFPESCVQAVNGSIELTKQNIYTCKQLF